MAANGETRFTISDESMSKDLAEVDVSQSSTSEENEQANPAGESHGRILERVVDPESYDDQPGNVEECSTSCIMVDTQQERQLLSTRSTGEVVQLVTETCQQERNEQIDLMERQMLDVEQENITLNVELGEKVFFETRQRRIDEIFQLSRELTRKSRVEEIFLGEACPLQEPIFEGYAGNSGVFADAGGSPTCFPESSNGKGCSPSTSAHTCNGDFTADQFNHITTPDEWEYSGAKPKGTPAMTTVPGWPRQENTTRPSQDRDVYESHNKTPSYDEHIINAIESSRVEPYLIDSQVASRTEYGTLRFSLLATPREGYERGGPRDQQLDCNTGLVPGPLPSHAEGRPFTLGINNAFLARHSQDRALVESLNQSSRGVSYDVHMMNVIESSRLNPYVVDSQDSSRACEHGMLRFSLSPAPREGLTPGCPGPNISVNRPVYSCAEFVQNSPAHQSLLGSVQLTEQDQLISRPRDNPKKELRLPGQPTLVVLPQEIARPVTLGIDIEFLARHSTDRSLVENCRMNDYNQPRNHSLGSPGLHATFSVEASNEDDSEPIPGGDAMGTSLHGAVRPDTLLVEAALSSGSSSSASSVESTISSQLGAMGQSVEDEAMEQDVADTWLQLVCSAANVPELSPYALESLNSVHNSNHTLVLSVERTRARLKEREEREGATSRWCSCDRGENDEEQDPICYLCHRQRYCGPHFSPYMDHHVCRYCLQDAFSGCLILPCSHPVHRECVITLIQGNMLTCPACGQAFLHLC